MRWPSSPRLLLDVLTCADLITGPEGSRVRAEDRVSEILSRYPDNDPVHRAIERAAPTLFAAVARFLYSLQAPHIELIEAIPGTPWTILGEQAIHHLGYFTDDMTSASAQLLTAGFTLEMRPAGTPQFPQMLAFYIDAQGIRIEIVDRSSMGDWTTFLDSLRPKKPTS
jgi:hypothetical protein